jgi:hypothetical protein
MAMTIQKIKDNIIRVARLSFWYWARMLIGALLGLLGGSTFIGFLNTYAIYWYCYEFGCRFPVEGVPYLSLAVALVSLLFLMTALTCGIGVVGLLHLIAIVLRRIATVAEKRQGVLPSEAVVPEESIRAHTIRFSFSVLYYVLVVLSVSFLIAGGMLHYGLFKVRQDDQIFQFIIVTLALAFWVFIVVLAVWPRLIPVFSVLLTIVLIGLICTGMFHSTYYGLFLRTIKYGGGSPLTITYTVQNDKQENQEGNLFLVTSKFYILYDLKLKQYVEIPAEKITRLQYPTGSQYSLPVINDK